MPDEDQGITSRLSSALESPFGNDVSWWQLAAATVFVLTVALAWRQVILFIGQEI